MQLPWRVSLVALLASVYGMTAREVRRMPLALALLYACAAAQHEGLSTTWREVMTHEQAAGVRARLSALRNRAR